MNDSFNNLHNRLLDKLPLHSDNLLYQRHLNHSLHHFLYRSILNNWLLDYSLHFFNSITVNWLLNYNLNLYWLFNYVMNLNYLLYDLRNLNDLLNSLDDRHDLLYQAIHWLVPDLNVVADLRGGDVLHPLNYLLNYFLNLNDLRHLNSNLNYLFYVLIHRHRLLNNFPCSYNLFPH